MRPFTIGERDTFIGISRLVVAVIIRQQGLFKEGRSRIGILGRQGSLNNR
jgi:hypothetical protein